MARKNKPRKSKAAKAEAQKNCKRKCRGNRTLEAANQTTQLAYRFEGYPTGEAIDLFARTFGCCRYLWNRMLGDWYDAVKEEKAPVVKTPAEYKKDPNTLWLKEVDSLALANTQLNFQNALSRYHDGISEFPEFKKKGVCKESFTTNVSNKNNPNLRLEGSLLKLPKLKQPVQLCVHRQIQEGGTLKNCTVTHEKDGKWMFSLLFEYPYSPPSVNLPTPGDAKHIGLDMSLPKLYVDSNGNTPNYLYPYRSMEKRIAREQRKLSRMKKGSNNYKKQRSKIAKLHAKAKRQRNDLLHKLSYELTTEYDVVGIENLDMAAMKRALKLGKSVSDVGWGNFVRMLKYKSLREGSTLIQVDKWFPSSKTCSKCGHIHKELTLSDRTYTCPVCGNYMDRDHQAAINIDREAMRIYEAEVCPLAA